jgi:hypothetical protein
MVEREWRHKLTRVETQVRPVGHAISTVNFTRIPPSTEGFSNLETTKPTGAPVATAERSSLAMARIGGRFQTNELKVIAPQSHAPALAKRLDMEATPPRCADCWRIDDNSNTAALSHNALNSRAGRFFPRSLWATRSGKRPCTPTACVRGFWMGRCGRPSRPFPRRRQCTDLR